MPAAEIQGDAAFTTFQAKLATAVTNARAAGRKIGRPQLDQYLSGEYCCPLGAHPDARSNYPDASMAQECGWSEVSRSDLTAFINAWGEPDNGPSGHEGPYAELGRRYRREFP
jgi:hypothetical protein